MQAKGKGYVWKGKGWHRNNKLWFLVFFCFVFMALGNFCLAGVLDDFEQDAVQRPSPKPSTSPTNYDGHEPGSTKSDNPMADIIDALFINTIYMTTSASWLRINYETQDLSQITIIKQMGLQKRRKGETLIPFFRFDYHYQNIESDVDASDFRCVAGYGPIGVTVRKTYLREQTPFDKLRIDQYYGIWRLSFSNYAELGLGIGEYRLAGNTKNSGTSFTMPLSIRATENFSVEFLPAWTNINGNEIEDYDLGLLVGVRFVSLKAGYRWIESPNDHLRGPYIGFSFYY